MLICHHKTELRTQLSKLRSKGMSIGFVPTMGALHEGHFSLVKRALKENDAVVCSIFVNPTQFNEASDFENYPNTVELDKEKLQETGCQIVYIPSVEDVYENEEIKPLDISFIEGKMEGKHRPGHFEGVVRVLNQFFKIIEPDKSYFGLKDYQQFLVVKELSIQMNLGGEIVGCETVREDSGLAKSSRNLRLSEEDRSKAAIIFQSFQSIKNAEDKLSSVLKSKQKIGQEFDLEYLDLRDGETLQEVSNLDAHQHIRAFFAGKIGNVRLIDNFRIK